MEDSDTVHNPSLTDQEPVKGSIFGHLDPNQPDVIFKVMAACNRDKAPNKVNLGVGGD